MLIRCPVICETFITYQALVVGIRTVGIGTWLCPVFLRLLE